MTEAERADFLATLNRAFDGKVEAIGWGHDGPAIRKMLKANNLPHQEAFLVGAGMGHQVLGEAAGLPLTKDIEILVRSNDLVPALDDASLRDAPQDEVSAVLRSP